MTYGHYLRSQTESAYADGIWQERADVPLERNTRSWCGYGERKSDSEQGKGPTRSARWMKHDENKEFRERKEKTTGDVVANGWLSSH